MSSCPPKLLENATVKGYFQIDPTIYDPCPVLDKVDVEIKYDELCTSRSDEPQCLTCDYGNSLNFENISEKGVNTWYNYFVYQRTANRSYGKTALETLILPYYCSQIVTTCPQDPQVVLEEGESAPALPQCMRLQSIDDRICAEWSDKYPEIVDQIKKWYCCKYKNAPECKCINRFTDITYQVILLESPELTPDTDHCWYIPCSNPSFYLSLSSEQKAPCPDICGIIINNLSDTDLEVIGLENFENSVYCPIPTEQTSASLKTNPSTSQVLFVDSTSSSIITSIVFWSIIVIILIGFLGLIVGSWWIWVSTTPVSSTSFSVF